MIVFRFVCGFGGEWMREFGKERRSNWKK